MSAYCWIDAFSLSNSKFTVGVSSLVNMYCRLTKRCDEARFPERHNPYSEFRIQVSGLEQNAKALLNDTFVSFLIRIVIESKSHYTHCASENNSAIPG